MNTIQNPIVPGDWSDPAVIRVSDDFYSLRSTFGWQPGLQIIHSKDLTHWEYIGYAYPSHASLTPGDTNGGCWGSELGYDPASKSFLAYATITSAGIQAFRSDLPGGPYDGPYPLEVPGIDPGFFADDDGRLYLVASRGEIWELTAGGLSVKRLVCNVGAGQDVGFEGPQIVKRDGWYYCIYSAGGTLPHEFSSINCARSRSLEGLWEVDPGNPLMQANDDSDAVLQGPAHGMLVDTAAGEWFLTYHAFELSHYSLGRQMC
ncbi:MAG: family 43 glycosylhydrolase, partial [Armatimonadota bacterium]